MSYERIVPMTDRRLRFFMRCIAVYLGAGCIAATSADAFWCGLDPSINWQVPPRNPVVTHLCMKWCPLANSAELLLLLRTNPMRCSSFTSARLQRVTWGLNIVGELLCEFSLA